MKAGCVKARIVQVSQVELFPNGTSVDLEPHLEGLHEKNKSGVTKSHLIVLLIVLYAFRFFQGLTQLAHCGWHFFGSCVTYAQRHSQAFRKGAI
jgi:hypothetical protein